MPVREGKPFAAGQQSHGGSTVAVERLQGVPQLDEGHSESPESMLGCRMKNSHLVVAVDQARPIPLVDPPNSSHTERSHLGSPQRTQARSAEDSYSRIQCVQ